MSIHKRVIYPVGQGGLAVEEIDGFRVMFDCGSKNDGNLVEHFIDAMKTNGYNQIDFLVLSHYDNDHVNFIKYLVDTAKIKVINAIVPAVPQDMEKVYNVATGGAYTIIRDFLSKKDCVITDVGKIEYNGEYVQKEGSLYSIHNINQKSGIHLLWQWDVHTMIKPEDWSAIRNGMKGKGISIERLNDADYVQLNALVINDVFKSKWRSSNGKGLVMLSQRTPEATVGIRSLQHDSTILPNGNSTSCLYTGDANLKNRGNINDIKDFMNNIRIVDTCLHLMQIPHHGSQWNVNSTFVLDFLAEYWFYCDENDVRAKKNRVIGDLKYLKPYHVLFVSNAQNTIIVDTVDVC